MLQIFSMFQNLPDNSSYNLQPIKKYTFIVITIVQKSVLSRTYVLKVKFDPSGRLNVDEEKMEINLSLRCAPVKGKANNELIRTLFRSILI
jgi:hypothetical protein